MTLLLVPLVHCNKIKCFYFSIPSSTVVLLLQFMFVRLALHWGGSYQAGNAVLLRVNFIATPLKR